MTQITTWVEPGQRSGPVIERRIYDVTGNVVEVSGPGGYHEAREYTADTQYGFAERVVVGHPNRTATSRP